MSLTYFQNFLEVSREEIVSAIENLKDNLKDRAITLIEKMTRYYFQSLKNILY